MTRTQHIFVDFENIQEVDLDRVAGQPVVVHLVLGEQHRKLPLEMVERLLKYQPQVRLVKAGMAGKNALDFVLAYRVGVESVADPKAYFHIVSNDAGYDALIQHLRQHQIFARRDVSFAKAFEVVEIPATLEDRVQLVVLRLTKNKTNRPKRETTLHSQINSYFGKKLTAAELAGIVLKLSAAEVIAIGPNGAVTYKV